MFQIYHLRLQKPLQPCKPRECSHVSVKIADQPPRHGRLRTLRFQDRSMLHEAIDEHSCLSFGLMLPDDVVPNAGSRSRYCAIPAV